MNNTEINVDKPLVSEWFDCLRQKRNCPSCQHWWFNRIKRGCDLGADRRTNTTFDLSNPEAAGKCPDFTNI